ncbi:MAG: ABC transporter ATP-binding protein [Saprospiraceae bacterium]|nr:ABC transporter ATP-binding protein [Saprospiraceae bacterium]
MPALPLLSVRDLRVTFGLSGQGVEALRGLTFDLQEGESLGIVGESGSGKSTLALALMGLLPMGARASGSVLLGGAPFSTRMRGCQVGMVFQEPATALHPLFRCGYQVEEVVRQHRKLSSRGVRREVQALLERVQLADSERIYRAYPHELSGGQRQRVMLAIALAGSPRLLIADEPTTALDTVTQQSILQLLQELQRAEGLSLLLISHDLGVVARVADKMLVLREGAAVETGAAEALLRRPQHAYTKGLLACRPGGRQRLQRLPSLSDMLRLGETYVPPPPVSAGDTAKRRAQLYALTPIVRLESVSVRYPVRRYFWSRARRWVEALRDLSLEIFPGEMLGIAGESGSGKSTLGRVVAGLQMPTSGAAYYRSVPLEKMLPAMQRQMRREVQVVFQDPYRSLNPRLTVGEALREPMWAHRLYATERQCRHAAAELLERVGLPADFSRRYPHELSGGQRQRVCLARALSVQPRLLVCDEITSALDVSVQADILNLLLDLQQDLGLTAVFISHDLSVLHQMCDRVLVLREGCAEAIDTPEHLLTKPPTPYVRRLVEALLL